MNATLSLTPNALAGRRAAILVALLLTSWLSRLEGVSAEPAQQEPQVLRTTPSPETIGPAAAGEGALPGQSAARAVFFSAPDQSLPQELSRPTIPLPGGPVPAPSGGVTFSAASEAPLSAYGRQPHGTPVGRGGYSPSVTFSGPSPLFDETYPAQSLRQSTGQASSWGVSFSAPGEVGYQIDWATLQVSEDPALPPGGDGSSSAADDSQTLGEAPEETNNNIQFLRQDTILLDPGQTQVDVTFQYLTDESDFALAQIQGSVLTVAEARRRQRLLLVPIELRLGITPVLQFFVNVPFGYSNNEFVFNTLDDFSTAGGIGDVSAGLTRQLVDGDEHIPDVLLTTAFSAPTGRSSFATSLSTPGSALGEGFWTTTIAVTCIRTYDPIVLFYGIGYRHRFENSFDNSLIGGAPIAVNPGKQSFYRFGAGFAVNPRVTLSASFFGSYIAADKVNAVRVAGGAREPMQVRLATTILRKEKTNRRRVRMVEPFVNLGLTEGAVDSLFGISLTH